MRVYLQSKPLGEALRHALKRQGKTQKTAAKDLKVAQGAISKLFSGRFKTKNASVERVCKYVDIDPDDFRQKTAKPDKIGRDAIDALARACGGQKQKTAAVIRVLRALEDLAPLP